MSGLGRVTLTALCSEPSTGRKVLRLETDWTGDRRSAVYILPQEPAPAVGDLVEWTTGRVIGHRAAGAPVQLRKIGYAFDPYPQFTHGRQQV